MFLGLKFQHSSSEGSDGYRFGQQSAVKMVYADDITISDCEFSHIGSQAVHVAYSSRATITRNVFFDIGYHGIMTMDGKNKAKMNGDAMISNNYLNGCGVTNFWQPACIWAQGMKNISVINNEATNVPNHAIR